MVNETRYLPKHKWYLADALLVVRDLQAAMWPLFHHVALGGGVLNHGYSDKDLDIYILPNYKPGVDHAALQDDVRTALSRVMGSDPVYCMGAQSEPEVAAAGFVVCGRNHDWVEGGCFAQSSRYRDTKGRNVDVFVVKAAPLGTPSA